MTLKLPFRPWVESVGRLHERYGYKWFTIKEAAHVIDEDSIERLVSEKNYVKCVGMRLHLMVERELLLSMKHRPWPSRTQKWMFQVAREAEQLVDFYRLHDEHQKRLDDVLDLL